MEIKDTLCKLDYTTDNLMDSLGERKDNPSKTRENWGEWFLSVSARIKLSTSLCTSKLKNSNCCLFVNYVRYEIRARLITLFLQNLNTFSSRHIRVVSMKKQGPMSPLVIESKCVGRFLTLNIRWIHFNCCFLVECEKVLEF